MKRGEKKKVEMKDAPAPGCKVIRDGAEWCVTYAGKGKATLSFIREIEAEKPAPAQKAKPEVKDNE